MDKSAISIEVLKMAWQLAINEYTDQRARDHTDWLARSEEVWRKQRLKLPYPAVPPVPSEADVLARAHALMGFLTDTPDSSDDEKYSEKIKIIRISGNPEVLNAEHGLSTVEITPKSLDNYSENLTKQLVLANTIKSKKRKS